LGWSSPASVLPFCGTGLAGLALVWLEAHRRHPLLDLRYFRSAPFTGACVIAAASYASFGSFLFLNSLYLQQARGLSALQAGIATLPMAAMTMVAALLSGRLIGHMGTRLPLAFGGACMLAGSSLMIGVGQATPLVRLLVAYALFGTGFGSVNPPINQTAVSGMPATQAGIAAATASTSRQVGQTLGVALLGAASVAVTSRGLASGVAGWPVPPAFGAGIVVVALITTGRWGMATAAHPECPVTSFTAGQERGLP
jgi:MFS family permease